MQKVSIRNSNVELLRIISIVLITLHHFSLWGQGERSDLLLKSGKAIDAFKLLIYLPLGDIGVYAFVMITGFYIGGGTQSLDKSRFRAFKIYSQAYFYSLLFLAIGLHYRWPLNNFPNIVDPLMPLNHAPNILMSVMPILFNHYWFITAYILLMLFLPIINKGLGGLNKGEFKYVLAIMIVICSIFPLLKNNVASESVGLGIVITSYAIGMYIRKFVKLKPILILKALILLLVNLLIIYSVSFYDIVYLKFRYINIFTGFFALMAAVGLFVVFISLKPRYSSSINKLASHMLAVYLITENIFVIKQLWKFVSFKNIADYKLVNLYGFLSVLLIMLICYAIDLVREKIFAVSKYIFIRFKYYFRGEKYSPTDEKV
ncbi:acyltransferase family protein [Companilactobacillus mishanensis]|uniref:Acyltransferase n=1 Tax=Companilactobacillus mishanensis TaxID=2486008 RepID=A0A5P0ZHX5_9LACO|nr:acyltransferase family protein [Companilactobacillus mishanensis]MQS52644.1 acyltransferase [Companilactobacillus mishanensis]